MKLKPIYLVFPLLAVFLQADEEIKIIRQPSQHHLKDKSGEIILRVKRAKWIFDCIDCHADFPTRTMPREMVSDHKDLNYDHIKGENWCFSCHYKDLEKRNRVKLTSGIYRGPKDLIKLCRQCHGEKTAEWEIGIHGKITGTWKTYGDRQMVKLGCHKCHSPHHPRAMKVIPMPGPKSRFKTEEKKYGQKKR
jgi:hypothetical protein